MVHLTFIMLISNKCCILKISKYFSELRNQDIIAIINVCIVSHRRNQLTFPHHLCEPVPSTFGCFP